MRCRGILDALWEGHDLAVSTVTSPKPLLVECAGCGHEYQATVAKVVGCVTCNVGLEMGENYCHVCHRGIVDETPYMDGE